MPRVHQHILTFAATVSIKSTWIAEHHSCEVKNEMALSANIGSMLAV